MTEVRDMQSGTPTRKKTPAATADYEQLDAGAKTELLMQLYKKDFGSEPKFPEAVTNIKAKPDLAAAKAEFLSKALHEHIAISESDLTALGQQRAMAVQQLLLMGTQIDPARVFLVANGKAKNQAGTVRLELSLK